MHRYNDQCQVFEEIFDCCAVSFFGDKYAKVSEIKNIFEKALYFVDREVRDQLYMTMDYSNKGLVDYETYTEIMRAWASFSAVDINNDNELDIKELKTLIWAMEGKEPDEKRMQKELKDRDLDFDKLVSRLEFITYLLTPSGEGQGYYDFKIKRMFDQSDINKDGVVDRDEFLEMVSTTIEDLIRENDDDPGLQNELMKNLGEGLFEELDKDGEGTLEWNEFKHFSATLRKRYKLLTAKE